MTITTLIPVTSGHNRYVSRTPLLFPGNCIMHHNFQEARVTVATYTFTTSVTQALEEGLLKLFCVGGQVSKNFNIVPCTSTSALIILFVV